jgi:hypothetical protein
VDTALDQDTEIYAASHRPPVHVIEHFSKPNQLVNRTTVSMNRGPTAVDIGYVRRAYIYTSRGRPAIF